MQENIELPDDDELVIEDKVVETPEPVEPETVQQNEDDSKPEEDDYSRRVTKRINKLVAERNREREQNEELRTKLREIEEANQKVERESEASKIEVLRKEKITLLEEGEYEEAAKIDEQLIDLKLQGSKTPVPVKEESSQVEIPRSQLDWLNQNKWFEQDVNSDRSTHANKVYLDMVNIEGYDPDDSDTYAELDKRLMPKQERKPPPPPTAQPDRGSSSGEAEGTGLTDGDRRRMREYGLNPNDARHRKAWLENKSR